MEDMKILDRRPSGIVEIPASKSLSHRAVICAALAEITGGGRSRLDNLGDSEDIRATAECMYRIKKSLDSRLVTILDCGESGSTLRFLIPIAAMMDREYLFIGRGRLMDRPLEVYERLFSQTNVRFRRSREGISLEGLLSGGDYKIPGNISSQFVSGLLLALPLAKDDSLLKLSSPLESAPYVKLTTEVMRDFGVSINCRDDVFEIPGGQRYTPRDYRVEGDYSQLAFFLAAGALGCDVKCAGLPGGSSQGDKAVLELIQSAGANVSSEGGLIWAEPSGAGLRAFSMDAREVPDLVPPVAALMCYCRGQSMVYNAARLRIKESDRLDALARQLSALGADITQSPDGLVINGKPKLQGGRVDAMGDHRIAMALAVAALGCETPPELWGSQTVRKSYPDFWLHWGEGDFKSPTLKKG